MLACTYLQAFYLYYSSLSILRWD